MPSLTNTGKSTVDDSRTREERGRWRRGDLTGKLILIFLSTKTYFFQAGLPTQGKYNKYKL